MTHAPNPRLTAGDKMGIERIVERLHVGTPDGQVIEYVRSRIKNFGRLPCGTRSAVDRYAITAHRGYQRLYGHVMSGSFGRNPRSGQTVSSDETVEQFVAGYLDKWYDPKTASQIAKEWSRGGGLQTLERRRVNLALLAARHARNPQGPRSRFRHVRKASPGGFHKGSFRTVVRGKHRVVIGCPKTSRFVRGRCVGGTRAVSVLHPKGEKNPNGHTQFAELAAKYKELGSLGFKNWLSRRLAGSKSEQTRIINLMAWNDHNSDWYLFREEVLAKGTINGETITVGDIAGSMATMIGGSFSNPPRTLAMAGSGAPYTLELTVLELVERGRVVRFPVSDMREASAKYSALRDQSGLGGSQFGEGKVFDRKSNPGRVLSQASGPRCNPAACANPKHRHNPLTRVEREDLRGQASSARARALRQRAGGDYPGASYSTGEARALDRVADTHDPVLARAEERRVRGNPMDIELNECSACGGALQSLGVLGRVAWFRCRACGLEQSREVSELGAAFAENPQGGTMRNPPAYFVVDPQTRLILGISRADKRGGMGGAHKRAYEFAMEAARRLGRNVWNIVHPYVPKGYKVGEPVGPGFHILGYAEIGPGGALRNPLDYAGTEDTGNVAWGKLPRVYSVELTGRGGRYVVVSPEHLRGKTVYWSGHEARRAQHDLERHRIDKSRGNPSFIAVEMDPNTGRETGRVETYMAETAKGAAQSLLYTKRLKDGRARLGPTGLVVFTKGKAWSVVPAAHWNPLTQSERGQMLREADGALKTAMLKRESWTRGYYTGAGNALEGAASRYSERNPLLQTVMLTNPRNPQSKRTYQIGYTAPSWKGSRRHGTTGKFTVRAANEKVALEKAAAYIRSALGAPYEVWIISESTKGMFPEVNPNALKPYAVVLGDAKLHNTYATEDEARREVTRLRALGRTARLECLACIGGRTEHVHRNPLTQGERMTLRGDIHHAERQRGPYSRGMRDAYADVYERFGGGTYEGNPPTNALKPPPWKKGQRVPVADVLRWARATGDRPLIEQCEKAQRLQTSANKKPVEVIWNFEGSGPLEAVNILVHYGDAPDIYYRPPRGSKKGSHLYRHKFGDTGRGRAKSRPVPVLVTPDGKNVVLPLGPGQKATDWFRG